MATKTTKRVAVTPETWRTLGDMKQAGQSYDDLIQELIHKANRAELVKKVNEAKERDEEELVPVDEL